MEDRLNIESEIDTLIDAFEGKENICSTLDDMFLAYLETSGGMIGEDLARSYELIMALKRIFK